MFPRFFRVLFLSECQSLSVSIQLPRFFQIVLELCNLSLCRKIFEHCHFVQNFPQFQRCYRKFNLTLLHLAREFFSLNGRRKTQFGSEFPPHSRNNITNSIQPFSIGLQYFFSNIIKRVLKKISPGFLRLPFLHRKTYSLKYWTCPL